MTVPTQETDRAEQAHYRRKRWMIFHIGVFAVVNAFFVGTWLFLNVDPPAPVEPEATEVFWPIWFALTWGVVLGVHLFYVVARKPRRSIIALPHVSGGQSGRVVRTVLFTDIVDSTRRAAEMGDRRWKELLDRHDLAARRLVERFGGRLVKQTGDGLLAVFETPGEGIQCAAALQQELRTDGIEIRAGLHAGEVDLRGRDVGGIGVHIASRVMSVAAPGEILVSRTVRDLASGSQISFEDRGAHELKGIGGDWQLFAVTGASLP
ncbi:MAG TPA: adenylate/guanylate cyclase domain-containing protein [Actinomycetota bacterium]|nr:adenylate/guanylate cyclase domain-containing protein [Actinomycetota bacterium]